MLLFSLVGLADGYNLSIHFSIVYISKSVLSVGWVVHVMVLCFMACVCSHNSDETFVTVTVNSTIVIIIS